MTQTDASAFDEPIDDYQAGEYAETMAFDKLKEHLTDPYWRLNNLYKIKDKEGKVSVFRMNAAQEDLYRNMHWRNIILKARQLGFTTFIDIFILDRCLFTPPTHPIRAGIIAHHMDDAKAIFDEKIKFPYENLDPQIRQIIGAQTDARTEMKFSNNSTIRVSTSFRSGTLQYLHVSEFGKIAAKYPEKAKEIISGAMEAVPLDGFIFVESTAEGRDGEFYNMTMTAKKLMDGHKKLTNLDFKFFFYPWWKDPNYVLDAGGVVVTTEDLNYFQDLEAQGIVLTDDQKAWWVKKFQVLGDEVFRENPSYPEEAFKASLLGAYYGKTISELRRKGRIGHVPYEPGFPVDTAWDLGMADATSIIFIQTINRERRVLDYYSASGEGMAHYANVLRDKGYVYGTHYMPHDIGVRELGTGKKRSDVAMELGISPISQVPRPKNTDQLLDQIEETRSFISTCFFDEVRCDSGDHSLISCLEGYRKDWDDKLGAFKRSPLHNWASHGADAFRTGAVGKQEDDNYTEQELDPEYAGDF
jgi:hypothetical protein